MYLMCGPGQLFFQCGPEMPKGWIPLLYSKEKWGREQNGIMPQWRKCHFPPESIQYFQIYRLWLPEELQFFLWFYGSFQSRLPARLQGKCQVVLNKHELLGARMPGVVLSWNKVARLTASFGRSKICRSPLDPELDHPGCRRPDRKVPRTFSQRTDEWSSMICAVVEKLFKDGWWSLRFFHHEEGLLWERTHS